MMHGSLPARLRVLRARRGLTLIDAAAQIGIGRDTLSDLERGNRHPVMPTLAKIAEGYGVPVEDLLEEPEVRPEAQLAGKDEAPTSGPLMDLPQVKDWLTEQDAHFALMGDEVFMHAVTEIDDLETLEELLHSMYAERERVWEAVSKADVGKTLFPAQVAKFTTRKERLGEAMRPSRDALRLRRELMREYRIKETAIENYSIRLFYEGRATDFLVHPRRLSIEGEVPEHVRREVLREALEEVAV